MKKIYKLEDLDCANCAAKMEVAIGKIAGVTQDTVNFISQKLTLEAADDIFDDVFKQTVKIIRKIEPDCRVVM